MNTARLFPNPVTLRHVTAWANERGAKVPASHDDTVVMAGVQPMRADRRIEYDIAGGQTAYQVFTASNPGLVTDDLILWGSRTLRVLAPATDQAGRGVAWRLDCLERKP
jgi:hypothetical protein